MGWCGSPWSPSAANSRRAAELLRGAGPRQAPTDQRATKDLLDGLAQLAFGPKAAARYGSIMSALDEEGTPVPAIDAMIAAIAWEAGARLITCHARHFNRIPGLVTKRPDDYL